MIQVWAAPTGEVPAIQDGTRRLGREGFSDGSRGDRAKEDSPVTRIRFATLAAMFLAFVAAPAAAIVVDSTADTVVAGDGACTLREAINNVNAGADTTGGDCATGSTITFDPSTDGVPIVLTGADGDDLNLSGDLDLAADVTITGNGPALTLVSGGGVDRVFDLRSSAAAITLEGLEVRDGVVGDGAGVRCNAAVNTLRDCRIVGNAAGDTGGASAMAGARTARSTSSAARSLATPPRTTAAG